MVHLGKICGARYVETSTQLAAARYAPVELYDGPPGFTQAFATTSSKLFPAEQVPSLLFDTARAPEGQPFFVRICEDDITDVVVGGCAKIAVRYCEALKLGHPESSKIMKI